MQTELTDDVATVYATWMRLMTTDVATPCAPRCLACRSRAPPQCVLCGGVACCPLGGVAGEAGLGTRGRRVADVGGSVRTRCSQRQANARAPARSGILPRVGVHIVPILAHRQCRMMMIIPFLS